MAEFNLKDRKVAKSGERGMALRLPAMWLQVNGIKPGDVCGVAFNSEKPGELRIFLKGREDSGPVSKEIAFPPEGR